MPHAPEFVIMTDAECRAVLERNHVGRLAFVREGGADIEPIGYVLDRDWLFARSGYGAKLEAIAHHPFVALEVDEVRGPFEWRSVVVHGTIYRLPADGSPSEREGRRRAIAAFRRLMPSAFTSHDPVPERDIVYGLHIDTLEGRLARSADPRDVRHKRQAVHADPRRTPAPGT